MNLWFPETRSPKVAGSAIRGYLLVKQNRYEYEPRPERCKLKTCYPTRWGIYDQFVGALLCFPTLREEADYVLPKSW